VERYDEGRSYDLAGEHSLLAVPLICGGSLAKKRAPSLAAPVVTSVADQTVSARDGNLVFTDAAGRSTQLTSLGADEQPSLSQDAKWIVFVRRVSGGKLWSPGGDVEPNEIWIIGTNGEDAHRLVRSRECAVGSRGCDLVGLGRPQFSVDGKTVFFDGECAMTSQCVSRVDLSTGKRRRVTDGSHFSVITKGRYRGDLVLSQHRYFLTLGSYDWWWVVTGDGKEVGPVGEWEHGPQLEDVEAVQ